MERTWARAGAVSALIGVAAGAFGTHGLRDRIPADLLGVFETGVRYQMYHAFGLFAVAWASGPFPHRFLRMAGFCFVGGTIFFSGSLYALSLSGIRGFGAVTPVGGLLFLAGWALIALATRSGSAPPSRRP